MIIPLMILFIIFLGDSNSFIMENEEILFRPHEVLVSIQPAQGYFEAEVIDIRPLGAISRITIKPVKQQDFLEIELTKDNISLAGLQKGHKIYFKPNIN